jgi:type II secretory pathway pseudopilin PulG
VDSVVVVALIGIAGTLLAGVLPRFLDHGAEQRNWTRDQRLARHGAFMTEMNNVIHQALHYQAAVNRGMGGPEQNAALVVLVAAKRDMRNALMLLGLVSGPDAFKRAQEASKAVNREDLWKLDPSSEDYKAINDALNAYGDAAARDTPR